MRADAIYRGVLLAKGEHQVRYAYEAPGLFEASMLALLGGLASLLALLRERSRKGEGGAKLAASVVAR